jgi:uncharacterized membrane protein YsdA (DUF1294 family)
MILLPGTWWILVAYAAINILVFCIYAHDKYKARQNAWRTREGTLLALAFIGPAGAYGSMLVFHHKTRKPRFFLVPVILLLHLILLGYLFIKGSL